MLPLLLTMLLTPPAPDLSGIYDSDNETILVIRGNHASIISTDGWSAVTLTLHVGPRNLRMVDEFGTAWFPWHQDGGTLRIGSVTYRRRPWLSPE
jgi:hypothetical protein